MKLSDIDKGIAQVRGIVDNVNERVQKLAVAIVEHKIDHNDCSRALALVNALPNSFRREYLIGWFQYFGAIGLNVKDQKVRNITDGRNYRPPNIDGAKANNWFEPFEPDGKTRKDWYSGPAPAAFEPNTLGDLGKNVSDFATRFLGTDKKQGQLFATKDNGAGKQVPLYDLTDYEKQQATTALEGMRKLGLMLMARERSEELTAEVVHLNDFVNDTSKVLDALGKLGKTDVPEELTDGTPVGQAVAG